MIEFQDFVPQIIDEGGLFTNEKIQDLRSVVEDANQWVLDNNVTVLNVETVVLPNIHRKQEEGSEDVSLRSPGKSSSYWHQFVRVWYKA